MIDGTFITIPPATLITECAYLFSNHLKKKGHVDEIDAEAIDLSADPTKPSALLVLALILIPIATITIGSFAPYFTPDGSFMRGFLSFIGNTGISMFIITMISMWTLRNYLPRASTVIFADGIKESGTVLTMLGFANVYAGDLQAAGVGEYIVGMLSNKRIHCSPSCGNRSWNSCWIHSNLTVHVNIR